LSVIFGKIFDRDFLIAALASRWWDKNSEFKPLHDINPLRLNYIKEKCGGSLKDKKILDVGCGGGQISKILHCG
jgi:2-polyprenyl-6-hydroxyphenyl methylase/3-demethylubiquinone-9 3-methyltransferase